MVHIIASALAPNIGTQLALQFIAGCFAATPLTCAGGSISDLWSPMERVHASPVFANAAFMGLIFEPIIGSFVGESSLVSWRWTEWIVPHQFGTRFVPDYAIPAGDVRANSAEIESRQIVPIDGR